jgi:predicted nucleic acid-binding protein
MKAVFDTNILVDYLNGYKNAAEEFSLYDEKVISALTYIEVLVGAIDEEEKQTIHGFLSIFQIREVDLAVSNHAIKLRQKHGLKVPDAIVYATAKAEGVIVVSRNTKDLKEDWPDVRVPYTL